MSVDASDLPDECPACGEDLTVDRRTDVETMHAYRKAETIEQHMQDEHRIIWYVSKKLAWIADKLGQLKP